MTRSDITKKIKSLCGYEICLFIDILFIRNYTSYNSWTAFIILKK